MILHSLTIENFKAIERETIEFGETGITLIEGRNESGKTSVFEAFRLLINTKSKSKPRALKESVRVGAESPISISAEMTIDGERIRYAKTYLSKANTSLEFLAPVKSSLRDDEAHEYVQAKLEDSANVKLWEKLSLRQDETSTQLHSVDEISSLKQALDEEAGDTLSTGDDSLFRRVKAERDQYLGKGGLPIGELRKLHDEVAERTAEYDAAREAAEDLNGDIGKLADAASKRTEKQRMIDDRKSALVVAQEKATVLAKAERVHDEFAQRSQLAQAHLDNAEHSRDRRRELSASVENSRVSLQRTVEAEEAAKDEEKAATTALVAATEDHAAAESKAREATGSVSDARRRIEKVEVRQELVARKKRRDKVEKLTNRVNDLNAQKRLIKADNSYVEELRSARATMREAEAGLKAGSSLVTVEGRGEAVIDGDTVDAAQGWSAYAENSVRLEIGDVTVSVVPPKNAAEAKSRFDDARSAFDALLADREYESIDAAESDLKKLGGLDTAIAETTGQRESALGESSAEHNRERISELEAKLEELSDGRDRGSVGDDDAVLVEAKTQLDEAETELEKANSALAGVVGIVNQARVRDAEARSKTASHRESLEVLRGAHDRAQAALKEARDSVTDESLEAAYDAAKKSVDDLAGEGEKIAATLAEAHREAQLHDLETTQQSLKRHQNVLDDLIRHYNELEARIKVKSEQGLATKKDEAEIALREAQQRCDSMQARANAADLLLTTLDRHRQQLISRYSAPLRERLVHYGKLVFGSDFDVSLDEHLVVKERKLDGTTVSFDQLSGGAKEQFGLLTRLVCAELVGDSTVPIFLDDTMGFTDPQRRQAMAAVLTEAGKTSQVIVLTCDEARFDAIGEATQHSMS